MNTLFDSIRSFPVLQWAQDHLLGVVDTGSENFYATCPICEGSRKLAIDRTWRSFHCWKCDPRYGAFNQNIWKGSANLIKMIMLVEHLSQRDAIDRIYKLSGLPDLPPATRYVQQEEFPAEAIPLKDCKEHKAAEYLKNRGVEHLIETSHVCTSGRYSDRILLETRFFEERTGFEAKSYHKSVKPKSLFPPSLYTGSTLYTTQKWNFDFDLAVITESIVDAETLRTNALGLYGSNLGIGQLQKLLELRVMGVKNLYWALDQDALWKQSKLILKNTTSFFNNYFVELPISEDPNSCGHDKCWELVSLAKPFKDEFDLIDICGPYI